MCGAQIRIVRNRFIVSPVYELFEAMIDGFNYVRINLNKQIMVLWSHQHFPFLVLTITSMIESITRRSTTKSLSLAIASAQLSTLQWTIGIFYSQSVLNAGICSGQVL